MRTGGVGTVAGAAAAVAVEGSCSAAAHLLAAAAAASSDTARDLTNAEDTKADAASVLERSCGDAEWEIEKVSTAG